ncbi:MAG: hypothetical protein NDF55_01455 [archaeon GB-1867-005]|nr:hypothetical protein [Candidatus Culexmicrobium cathedralense]
MKLGKKTPNGFYIIIARREAEKYLKENNNVKLESIGDIIIIKTKSRNTAKKILEKLRNRNLLLP